MATQETEVHLVLVKPISEEIIRVQDPYSARLARQFTEESVNVLKMKIVNPTQRTVSLCNFTDTGGFYINYIQFRDPSTGLWGEAHGINMKPVSSYHSYQLRCGNGRHHYAKVIHPGEEKEIGGHFNSSRIDFSFNESKARSYQVGHDRINFSFNEPKAKSYRVGRSYFIGQGTRSPYDAFHCTSLSFNEGEGIAWSKEMLTSYGKFFQQEVEASAKLIGKKHDFKALGAALSHRHVSNDSDLVAKFVSHAVKAGLSSFVTSSSVDRDADGEKKMGSSVYSPGRKRKGQPKDPIVFGISQPKGQPKDPIVFGITSYGLDCKDVAEGIQESTSEAVLDFMTDGLY